MLHSIGKYAQSWFDTEYSIYTPLLSLWINGCQLIINCMWYETHNKSFGSVLTAIIEVRKRIDYIFDDIFVSFYWWMYDVVVYDV